MHELDLDLYNGSMSNINMPKKRRYATFYVLAIAMSVLSVAVYEIITFESPNVFDSNL